MLFRILFFFGNSMCGKKWKNSDEEKVHLEKIDFDAAGRYYCEVSTETPIYTKESNIEQVHVIGKFNRNIRLSVP